MVIQIQGKSSFKSLSQIETKTRGLGQEFALCYIRYVLTPCQSSRHRKINPKLLSANYLNVGRNNGPYFSRNIGRLHRC